MEIIDEFPKRLSVGILGSTGVAELPAGGATGMDWIYAKVKASICIRQISIHVGLFFDDFCKLNNVVSADN